MRQNWGGLSQEVPLIPEVPLSVSQLGVLY